MLVYVINLYCVVWPWDVDEPSYCQPSDAVYSSYWESPPQQWPMCRVGYFYYPLLYWCKTVELILVTLHLIRLSVSENLTREKSWSLKRWGERRLEKKNNNNNKNVSEGKLLLKRIKINLLLQINSLYLIKSYRVWKKTSAQRFRFVCENRNWLRKEVISDSSYMSYQKHFCVYHLWYLHVP